MSDPMWLHSVYAHYSAQCPGDGGVTILKEKKRQTKCVYVREGIVSLQPLGDLAFTTHFEPQHKL